MSFRMPRSSWGERFLALQEQRRRAGLGYACPTDEQMDRLEMKALELKGITLPGVKLLGVPIDENLYLGITFDDKRLLICRPNYRPIEVSSELSRTLLRILWENQDRFTSRDDLFKAWEPFGADLNTLNKELSCVRKVMRKLGIKIENRYGCGWRLSDSSGRPHIKGKNSVRKK
jgi:hypothetical protein